jgi:hypothetical protein
MHYQRTFSASDEYCLRSAVVDVRFAKFQGDSLFQGNDDSSMLHWLMAFLDVSFFDEKKAPIGCF